MHKLKNNYEDQLKHLQENNDLLKQNPEEAQGLNVKHVENITTLEQQLEDFQFIYVASSFSKFTKEEFQELASKIQHDLNKVMLGLFEGLNYIQETYNSFEHQFDLLYDHNKTRKHATKYYDDMVDWTRYIKDKPEDVPILDKIKLRRIKISLESWENVKESVESTIRDGHIACKKIWFASKNPLSFMDLRLMDPIQDALPPKIMVEQVERELSNSKE